MSLEEEESFIITWRVKNFSMSPVGLSDPIVSPVFQVKQFGDSEWTLILYPKGELGEPNFVSCYLKCMDVGVYEMIKLIFSFSVAGISSDIFENDFVQRKGWGCNDLISMEDILKEKEKYLPNDTLNIKCSMKCETICYSENAEDEITDSLLRASFYGKKSLYFNECCCETIIPVQTKMFLRPIQGFLSLSENERITLPLFSAVNAFPSFYVTIIKKSESPIHIVIKSKEDISENTLVKCTVSVVNAPKGLDYSSEDEFLFTSEEEVWDFSPFLELKKLVDDGYFKINEDVLFLQFNISCSMEDQMYHIEKQKFYPFFSPFKNQRPLEIFTESNSEDNSAVVTLCARDRPYTVHKALLKAKSEVFRAMFEDDMKEKETGNVDIHDVKPETLARMVSFLYSGTVVELSTKDLSDLYAAADKYQIQCLIDHCTTALMKSSRMSNVCDILILADLYHNDRLLKWAEENIVRSTNPERLFVSPDWKNLMKNHTSIAADVMYKMLMK